MIALHSRGTIGSACNTVFRIDQSKVKGFAAVDEVLAEARIQPEAPAPVDV